jgi:hypothetical protein
MLKTWRIQNIRRLAKLGAWENVSVHRNVGEAGKVGGAAGKRLLFGSAESATADFSLVPLMSTFSSISYM